MIRGKIRVPVRYEIETSKGLCITDGDFFFEVDLDFFGDEELTEIANAIKENIVRLSTQSTIEGDK